MPFKERLGKVTIGQFGYLDKFDIVSCDCCFREPFETVNVLVIGENDRYYAVKNVSVPKIKAYFYEYTENFLKEYHIDLKYYIDKKVKEIRIIGKNNVELLPLKTKCKACNIN